MMQGTEGVLAVPDPYLEIRGGGLRASVWSKNKGAGPPGPSPRSATDWYMPQPISGGDAHMQGFDFPHSQYPVC